LHVRTGGKGDRARRVDVIGPVLRVIFFHENYGLLPDRTVRNRFDHAAQRRVILRDELICIENLFVPTVGMIVWQPDVMKLRKLPESYLGLEIFSPFAHAIQIRSFQVSRAKAERIMIQIISEATSQAVVAFQYCRETVVAREKQRQATGERLVTE